MKCVLDGVEASTKPNEYTSCQASPTSDKIGALCLYFRVDPRGLIILTCAYMVVLCMR